MEWLADFLRDEFESRGGALRATAKIRIFLRYVGDPGFQSGVAEDIGVHQTTVYLTVATVSDAIVRKSNV